MSRTLLITGATGKQGGAVIRSLLARKADFQILALTRDVNSPSAKRLASSSPAIKLLQGDLDHAETIFQSAKLVAPSIWGVFSVQVPAFNKNGPAIEEKQGKALVDEALQHGVRHFVYSSVDRGGERSSSNPTDVPHFASKHNIEQHLTKKTSDTDMAWTILRPVAFMENLDGGFLGKVFATAWKTVVKTRPLQLVAVDDIGVLAAKAFTEPEAYKNREISIAGDELSYEQFVEVYQRATKENIPTTWGFVARFLLWMSEELGTMYSFFEREGYGANVAELKKELPELQNLEEWLRKNHHTN